VSVEHIETRPGAYADSVALMQASAQVRQTSGVEAALVAMGTDLNLSLLAEQGFAAPPQAGPNDLIVAVRARDRESLAAALAALAGAVPGSRPLPAGQTGPAGAAPTPGAAGALTPQAAPRTVSAAVRAHGPGLALISVPGQHAFTEAMDALDAGCDVMIFSDNVPVEQEILLKDTAARRGLLVMGPDCGTALIGGVGLGFSHSLPPGPIGIAAASGTGAQQVLCLLDAAGTGVTAVLGTGGRDLSAAVNGRSTRAALTALDAEPGCALILVISKPPDPAVAADLREFAARLGTPVRFAFLGPGEPDLTAATGALLTELGVTVPRWPAWPGTPAAPRPGALRGLFAGGSLCTEAMVIASERLGPVRSNIPLRPDWRLPPDWRSAPGQGEHIMVDFGDDELTAGRPHPMIDQSLRAERLAAEAAGPATAVILLDVVLGHGAHPDPAAELAPVIADTCTSRGITVAVSLIGARSDPQDPAAQTETLRAAGAHVFASNAQAARFACGQIESQP
jgi:FdrA protein